MRMDEEARAWLDATVRRALQGHHLSEPERAGVHYELMSHLHAAAEAKAREAGRDAVTVLDLQSAHAEAGGDAGLRDAFVAPLARAPRASTLGRRFVAWFVDALLVSAALWVVGMALMLALAPLWMILGRGPFGPGGYDPFDPEWVLGTDVDMGPFLLLGLLAVAARIGYFTWFEGTDGRTIGKRIMDLRVVRVDGRPTTYREALLRNVAKGWFFLLLVDTLLMLVFFKDTMQRASDRIAETMVVDERPG